MRFVRYLSMMVTLAAGFVIAEPAQADQLSFCGVCYDFCPGQSHADNACAGMGCATGADACIVYPLCAEPDVLIVCDGNVE